MESVPILVSLQSHVSAGVTSCLVESSASCSERKSVSHKLVLEFVKTLSVSVHWHLNRRPEGTPPHVAFLVTPSVGYVVVELSVWAAGGVAVPLSVHSPTPELEFFCTDSEAQLIISDEMMTNKIQPVGEKLGRVFAVLAASSGDTLGFELRVVDVETPTLESKATRSLSDNALILYTSGTTGRPKGAVHTFESLTSQMQSLKEAWGWSPCDYTLHVLPLHHIHGVQNILNTGLFCGASVEFTPFDAAHCLRRLTSGEITCFHAVPTVYTKFTQYYEKLDDGARTAISEGLRNPNLRLMVCGSAALPVPTMKTWATISGHVLLERYGMTETGMNLSNIYSGRRYPGCVGWALPKVEVTLSEDGGILIKGPLLFREYYKREDATKETFNDDGWFITGDTAEIGGDADALKALVDNAIVVENATGRASGDTSEVDLTSIFKIMGRSSVDIIKSGGYKIGALEIESVLLQHERIKECAIVGQPDETWGEKVTAVCVLDGELSIEELRAWGKERIASYKVPMELISVDELPRNQLGKLEKKKILERFAK